VNREALGHTPTPLILDTTVLSELARGDAGTIQLIQQYDAAGQPMVVPTLAITWTLLDTHTETALDALHGLSMLAEVTVAPLRDAEQATSLATVIATTGLDAGDAHVAAVADAAICPILTRDAVSWQQPSAALDNPLHVIEIADPDRN
jgi:predicted nucleic acid-binding protein